MVCFVITSNSKPTNETAVIGQQANDVTSTECPFNGHEFPNPQKRAAVWKNKLFFL